MNRLIKLLAVVVGAVQLCSGSPAKPLDNNRLRLVPLLTDGLIQDIQESPDGTRLLTHDRGYAPRLWDPRSMRILGFLSHDTREVSQAEMSKSGRIIVTSSFEEVKVWDAKTARLITSFNDNRRDGFGANRFAISSDDNLIALSEEGSDNGAIWLGKAPDYKFERVPNFTGNLFAYDAQFSPDNTKIAIVSGGDQEVVTYDLITKSTKLIAGDPKGHSFVQWSPDSKQLLLTGVSNEALLCEYSTGKIVGKFPHFIGDRGALANTLMAAIFVGPNLSQFVVCGENGVMSLYDRNSLNKVRELTGYSRPIREIRKSPDGLRIATYEDNDFANYDPLKIWDVTTGKEFPFERAGGPTAGAFNADGTSFWVGYRDGSIAKHSLTDGSTDRTVVSALQPLQRIQFFGQTGRVGVSTKFNPTNFFVFDSRKLDLATIYSAGEQTLANSPNGEYALSPGYSTDEEGNPTKRLACWQLSTQKPVTIFNPNAIGNVWLADNTFLVWTEKAIFHYNPANASDEQFLGVRYESAEAIRWVKPSADGKVILVAYQSSTSNQFNVQVVNIPSGELGATLGTPTENVPDNWAIAANQPLLFVNDQSTFAFNSKTGESLWNLKNRYIETAFNQYSLDGSKIYYLSGSTFRIVDPNTGKIVSEANAEGIGEGVINSSIAPDLNLIAFHQFNLINFFDSNTGKHIRTIKRPGSVTSIEFIQGQNRILIADSLQQVSIWDTQEIISKANPEPLGSLVIMDDSMDGKPPSWLVMDRDGRYDANDPNQVLGANYVLEWEGGLQPILVSQLKSLFYEPGLFAKLAGYDPDHVRPVPDRNQLKLFPEIAIEKSQNDPNRLNISLTERDGGGIGKTEILLNGKLVQTANRTGYISLKISDFQQFLLPSSQLQTGRGNTFSIVAYNAKGDLASLPESIDVGVPEGLKTPEVNIYALFVGVGDYVGASRDLTAPPYDAQALERAIRKSGERLLPNRVNITTLTTASAKSDPKNPNPSREAILAWFESTAQKATSSDIILVFFAGHGTSQIGDQSGYFFLTAGADPSSVTKSILGVHTISGEDLKTALAKIPAAKQVIILDTCHSGAAAGSLVQDRSVSGDYVRAYEAIRESSGTWLLAGSAADQLSYESRAVDHGLLTYSLLEAIDQVAPEALRGTPSGEYFLDVERWLSYAAARVETLRNEVGISGVQKPELKRSNYNQSFDIGVTRPQFRGEIALTPPKPIVLLGTFDEDGEDKLGLESALAKALENEPGYKLWLNVAKHPRTYRIAGQYTREDGKLKVRLFIQLYSADLQRNNLKVIPLEGPENDLQGMVDQIRKTVAQELAALKSN